METDVGLKSRMRENCMYGSARGSRQAFHIEIEIWKGVSRLSTRRVEMIRVMEMKDYDAVYKLWEEADEVCINPEDDSYEKITMFLLKNPDLCYVATCNERIIGAIMAGDDGRRGHIYHTVVSLEARNRGIGKKLVNQVIRQFERKGIREIDLLALENNLVGNNFWEKRGFLEMPNLVYRRKSE